jgi:glycosyltransferase involved in cell wall biosynthesis
VIPPLVPERKPLDARELRERLARLGVETGRYAFYPANFWPHKNHARLLTAAARAPGEVRLVLCGALADARERLRSDAGALGLASRVEVLPYLEDADVSALLQGARFLFFPSLFEGFGIPVLEAFRIGAPVACSDIPALSELAGDAALLFDPKSPDAIASALAALWNDDAARASFARRGRERARLFDGGAAADRWADVLSSEIDRRSSG